MMQIGIDEIENRIDDVGIGFQRTSQLVLDDSVKAKASGNSEDYGKHGNSCQHAAVSKSRCIVKDAVFPHTLPCDDEPFQYP